VSVTEVTVIIHLEARAHRVVADGEGVDYRVCGLYFFS
jgi:hypothetical protein